MSEITPWLDHELRCVESCVGELYKEFKKVYGIPTPQLASRFDHLIDELLFLRACLHKHPPYFLTLPPDGGIMLLGKQGDQ